MPTRISRPACDEELRPLVEAYEARKAHAGRLDFLDLLVLTRDLVQDNDAVRSELQQRFTHILVDEFQDTDPLQAEILLLLAADDPAERDFSRARAHPREALRRRRPEAVDLPFSPRRRDALRGDQAATPRNGSQARAPVDELPQRALDPGSGERGVRAVDAREPGREPGRVRRAPALPRRAGPDARRRSSRLPVPRPYGDYGKITNYAIDESLPDAVGAFVDWLVHKSGWTVTEREHPDVRVPIEARHVCLLTRALQSFGNDLTRAYVRALEARQLPHVLVGGRSFHRREEVVALRNALAAIEWPDDDMSVFATLRGPFFALSDESILAFRHRPGKSLRSLHPLLPVPTPSSTRSRSPVKEALGIVGRLHLGRNKRPIADTIAQLLDATRAHAAVAIWPTGEQSLANLLRVLDHARRFEATGATSFRAFVVWLREEAERDGSAEAPVVEEGTDGVRIMTVFKAKGLEFPVVILIDPTCPHTQQKPSRYVDGKRRLWAMPLAGCAPVELVDHADELRRHDADEAVRITYVAATRARDLLVVPVVGDEPWPGWVDVLHPALYPKFTDARNATVAPVCPPFGDDAVAQDRPYHRGPEDSVVPGQHTPQVGPHKVVFWDPNVLELDKEARGGLRQQRILAVDGTGAAAAEGDRAHAEWRSRRAKLLEHGSVPQFRVETVTAADPALAPSGVTVTLETTAARPSRPHGTRFGSLVHETLASVSFDADEARVLAAARTHGQMLAATAEEIAAGAEAVSRALVHPVLQSARAAGEACRRETPLLLRLEDGSLVEGVVDLAYREQETGSWVVVDFKTDVEMGNRREGYEKQVALYARAIAHATGEPARGVLLHV